MSDKQFFNNLSATYADVRKLDAKKINLKGKNILEYISENKTNVLDERGTNANDELDIWNSYVTKDENGNVIVDMTPTPKEHSIETFTDEQLSTIRDCAKVINNEVLDADDNHLMYWQTDGLTDGSAIFTECYNLTIFNSDLSSLTFCDSMFIGCSNLTSFNSDLSSLTNGFGMFIGCPNLTSFNSELPSLTDGYCMFSYCENLTSFNSELPSLTNGEYMFDGCPNLTSFSSDLSSLTNGYGMFSYCENLTSFSSDLSSLTDGECMFDGCSLDAQSVANIIHFLPKHDDESTITIGLGIVNTDEAKQAFAEECYCDDWEELNKEF